MTEIVRYCTGCDKTFRVLYINGMKLPDKCPTCLGTNLQVEVCGSVRNESRFDEDAHGSATYQTNISESP